MTNEELKVIARYYVGKRSTLRETSKKFGYSKTYIHTCFSQKLPKVSSSLANQVKEVTRHNIKMRASRGGHNKNKNKLK